jgi:hypothetical protein
MRGDTKGFIALRNETREDVRTKADDWYSKGIKCFDSCGQIKNALGSGADNGSWCPCKCSKIGADVRTICPTTMNAANPARGKYADIC